MTCCINDKGNGHVEENINDTASTITCVDVRGLGVVLARITSDLGFD